MARRGSWRYSYDGPAQITTTPFLCLVLIIIPMLLFSTMFVQFAVMPIAMPMRCLPPPDAPPPPDPLALYINHDGFRIVKGESPSYFTFEFDTGEEILIPAKDSAGEVESYDWMALYNTLVSLKQSERFEQQNQLFIIASGTSPHEVIVRAMDISQYQRAPVSWADEGTEFQTESAMVSSEFVRVERDGRDELLELFPRSALMLSMSR